MSTSEDSTPVAPGGIHQQAQASDRAHVYMAGRDQHLYYGDGKHGRRRTESGPVVSECPYPGLAAFEPEQARWFFGRNPLVADLITRLDRRLTTGGLQIVVAPSGAGKSSLLRAGLLPLLDRAALPGSDGWLTLLFTPTAAPMSALDARLSGVTREREQLVVVVDQFEELFTLCEDDRQRGMFIDALADLADGNALVVLGVRADFYAACVDHPRLAPALQDAPLVVGPMTDTELREAILHPAQDVGLDVEPGLVELLLRDLRTTTGGSYEAGRLPLLAHALRACWQQRHGSTLTVQGYKDTGGIQHAIAVSAEHVYTSLDDEGRRIARSLFLRLIRIGDGTDDTRRFLARAELDASQTALRVVNAFTKARLITQQHDTVGITHEALLRAWPRLRDWITVDRDWLRTRQHLADDATAWEKAGRDPSLLYRGNRLAAVRESADRASTTAAEWEPVLVAFLNASWRQERRGVRRRRLAVAFLAALALLASVGMAGSLVFQRQAMQARDRDVARYLAAEAEDLRDRRPGLAKQLSLMSYRIDPEAGRGAVFNSQRTPGVINDGETAHDLAASADGRVLAISTGDTIVLRALRGPGSGRVSDVLAGPIAIDRSGDLLAAAVYDTPQSGSATVRLWDITDLSRPREIAAPRMDTAIDALVVGADGRTLYAGASTGEIHRWDIGDRAAPRTLPSLRAHAAQIDSLAVAPMRNLLASVSVDGRAHLWDIADAANPDPIAAFTAPEWSYRSQNHLGPLHRVAFDPSGQLLAMPGEPDSGDDRFILWRLDDPATPRRVPMAGRATTAGGDVCRSVSVTSVAFNPSKRNVVEACGGRWQVWTYATDADPGTVEAGASSPRYSEVGTIVFDPGNERRLLHATNHGVQVWDLSTAAQPGAKSFLPLTPETDALLAYRPVGQRQLLSVHTLGSSRQWDVTDVANATAVSTNSAPAAMFGQEVALSPDGAILATDESPGNGNSVGLRLRSTADPTGPPLATIDIADSVGAVAFSPTRPILAVSDVNRTKPSASHATPVIRIYDIADPRQPRQISRIETRSFSVTFSPDGATLTAAITPDDEPETLRPIAGVRLRGWDLTDPARPTETWTRQLPPEEVFADLSYRPDGGLFAAYSTSGALRLWHVDRGRLVGDPVRLRVSTGGGSPMAFNPDGTLLALIARPLVDGSYERRPEVWNLSEPRTPVRQSYLPGDDSVFAFSTLAFSPDGGILAVVRPGVGVDLWETDPANIATDLCNSAGDPITRQQWEQYLPNRPYEP
ncbi:MAG: WD40 repeat domain-containing protein, partial [Hamadaea sp.]|nr:WD40 repeat domain-containing protein [Hamadaea sp.]